MLHITLIIIVANEVVFRSRLKQINRNEIKTAMSQKYPTFYFLNYSVKNQLL